MIGSASFTVAGVGFGARPVTAIALQVTRPEPRHQSLQGRSLRLWLLGSGLPFLGVITVALFALFEPAATVRGIAVSMCALAAGGFFSGMTFNLLSSSRVSAPVKSVTTGMRRVSEGRYDTEVVVYDDDAVTRLPDPRPADGATYAPVDSIRTRENP